MVLGEMHDAVQRANRIIQELLQFSGVAAPAFKPENINEVIERSLSLMKYQIDSSRVVVTCDLAVDLPRVSIDRVKMEQVLINVLTNAMHAISGQGTITVRTHGERDVRHFGPGANRVVIEVRDTGSGIPEADLPRIFNAFFTTKPAGIGTGLGLSVIKRILDLHGATISVKNVPPGGVLVAVTLRALAE
jgi:signal transduction histidine kinase